LPWFTDRFLDVETWTTVYCLNLVHSTRSLTGRTGHKLMDLLSFSIHSDTPMLSPQLFDRSVQGVRHWNKGVGWSPLFRDREEIMRLAMIQDSWSISTECTGEATCRAICDWKRF
jgi:hypothetical protein